MKLTVNSFIPDVLVTKYPKMFIMPVYLNIRDYLSIGRISYYRLLQKSPLRAFFQIKKMLEGALADLITNMIGQHSYLKN